jgi:protein phosphatase
MRALDGINAVEADLSVREARVGDRYMLCTDGLSGVVDLLTMSSVLTGSDPTGAVTRLVDLALEHGAPDNVTVVVADVVDVPRDDAPGTTLTPVVVGAAGEPRVRSRLPTVRFPDDAQPDPDRPDTPPPAEPGPPTQPQPLIDAQIVVPAAMRARQEAASEYQARLDRGRRRRRAWAVTGAVAAVLLGLAVATMIAFAWVNSQWYVAVNGNAGTGTIAIYQGVNGSLLGVPLSALRTDTDLQIGTLPYFDQENVSKGITAANATDAQRIVGALRQRAAVCLTVPPPTGCPGAPA